MFASGSDDEIRIRHVGVLVAVQTAGRQFLVDHFCYRDTRLGGLRHGHVTERSQGRLFCRREELEWSIKVEARLYDLGLMTSVIKAPELTLSPDGKSLAISVYETDDGKLEQFLIE